MCIFNLSRQSNLTKHVWIFWNSCTLFEHTWLLHKVKRKSWVDARACARTITHNPLIRFCKTQLFARAMRAQNHPQMGKAQIITLTLILQIAFSRKLASCKSESYFLAFITEKKMLLCECYIIELYLKGRIILRRLSYFIHDIFTNIF